MKILSNIKTAGGNVVATLSLHEMTTVERERITQFGELSVDFGGTFDSDDYPELDIENLTFTLSSRILNVPSGMPVVLSIDLDDAEDAPERARVWVAAAIARCSEALVDLNAREPASDGDAIHTIPLPNPG